MEEIKKALCNNSEYNFESEDTELLSIQKLDKDIWKYMKYMCKKGCIFFDKNKLCLKHRRVQDCARKGLKNKEVV